MWTGANIKTDNFLFYKDGNISGWDEIRTFTVKVKNTRSTPVTAEIIRNFGTSAWKLKKEGNYGTFEKVDMDTVKFTVKLQGKAHTEFHYTLTTFHGKRAE